MFKNFEFWMVIIIKKFLLAGFEGETNSAKILLDKLSSGTNIEKLYLKNDFDDCVSQLINHIRRNSYDFIISFGQKPIIKSVYIETIGCIDGLKHKTTFQYDFLKEWLTDKGYKIKISDNAGNYLCNHVYGMGLRYIERQKLLTQYIFVHIPYIKNLYSINDLATAFDEYIIV